MISQKIKCILKAVIPPILIAICILVIGISVVGSWMISYTGEHPIDEATLYYDKQLTPVSNYQISSVAIAPIIIIIIGIILGYYWFIKPCLVKEKSDNGDKT